MQDDYIAEMIGIALDENDVSKLRTVLASEMEHVEDIYHLIKNYSNRPFSRELLKKLYKKPVSEVCMEILYGTTGEGMEGFYAMESKAGVVAVRNRKNNSLSLLRFAHDPWFDPEIAVVWADNQINKYRKRRKTIKKTCWFVDEKNLTLQLLLKKLGYIAQPLDIEEEEIIFIKE